MDYDIVYKRYEELKDKLNKDLSEQELQDLETFSRMVVLLEIFDSFGSEVQELFYKTIKIKYKEG